MGKKWICSISWLRWRFYGWKHAKTHQVVYFKYVQFNVFNYISKKAVQKTCNVLKSWNLIITTIFIVSSMIFLSETSSFSFLLSHCLLSLSLFFFAMQGSEECNDYKSSFAFCNSTVLCPVLISAKMPEFYPPLLLQY